MTNFAERKKEGAAQSPASLEGFLGRIRLRGHLRKKYPTGMRRDKMGRPYYFLVDSLPDQAHLVGNPVIETSGGLEVVSTKLLLLIPETAVIAGSETQIQIVPLGDAPRLSNGQVPGVENGSYVLIRQTTEGENSQTVCLVNDIISDKEQKGTPRYCCYDLSSLVEGTVSQATEIVAPDQIIGLVVRIN